MNQPNQIESLETQVPTESILDPQEVEKVAQASGQTANNNIGGATDPSITPSSSPSKPQEHSFTDLVKLLWQKFGWILLTLIGITILIFAMVFGLKFYQAQKNQAMVSADDNIKKAIFQLRLDALEYYQKHMNYQNWDGNPEIRANVQLEGSEVQINHPDYQSFVIYAQLKSNPQFFCIDNTGFYGEVANVTATQKECQK